MVNHNYANAKQDNKTARQLQGFHAENHACHYLQKAGLVLLARNFSCKFGEIDLVMREQDTIVFVEVRYRQSDYYGDPLETITRHKQQRIRRAAQIYLQQNDKEQDYYWRYDWVGITGVPSGPFKTEWIQNAWEEDY